MKKVWNKDILFYKRWYFTFKKINGIHLTLHPPTMVSMNDTGTNIVAIHSLISNIRGQAIIAM